MFDADDFIVGEGRADKPIGYPPTNAFVRQALEKTYISIMGALDVGDFETFLKEVADLDNPIDAAKYTAFIDAIIETGDGPRLIHELASDPSEAERIFKLSPVKQGIALAKLAAMEAPASTAAPKPITPVGNRAGSRIPITPDDVGRADNLSTAEWMARRNQQVEEQRKTRRGY